MIGASAKQLEKLIRIEMKPFDLCLALMEIRVKRFDDSWKACIDGDTARQHPDCFAALTRSVWAVKQQFFLEE